jgi:hypothetical protein
MRESLTPERDELDKWAAAIDDRCKLEDFLDWLGEQRIEPCQWTEKARWPMPMAEGRVGLLNRYFGIDAKRLDEQRRALLAEAGG